MKYFSHILFPPREAPGGEAGGAAAAPAAGGVVAPSPAAQGQNGGDGAGAWTRPEGLPARFLATTKDQFDVELLNDWRAQHAKLSGLPAAPKSVDDYKFEPSDKAKDFVGDLSKDPVYDAARKAALAAGVPAAAFQTMISGVYDQLADAGLLAKPIDAAAEAMKFLGKTGLDPQAAMQELAPQFQAAWGPLEALLDGAKLGAESKAALLAVADTADGLRALTAISAALKTPGVQPGGQTGGVQGFTEADLLARQKDPRNNPQRQEFDREFMAQTVEMAKKVYGA